MTTTRASGPRPPTAEAWSSRAAWGAAALGVGIVGTLDEAVLHQLLRWHHFYDGSTPAVGQITDGVFHLFTALALVWGGLQAAPYLRSAEWRRRAIGWVLVGGGGFNLFDGIVDHKILGLHQIRPEAPSQLPYDVVFVAIALVVLAVGWSIVRRSPADAAAANTSSRGR